ncbi:MAG: twin-arginine translocation signal domain-containing protein, partial [Pseudomonadota bacterium]
MKHHSRRDFLRRSVTAACAGGLLPNLLTQSARAADTSGYKALVCLFFFGGIDNNDVLIPRDNASYNLFSNTRESLLDAYAANAAAESRLRADLVPLNPLNSG